MATNPVTSGVATIGDIAQSSGVREALQFFTREKQWINEQHLELCRIPSPTFIEHRRAEWMAAQFRAYGCWVLPRLIQTGAYTRAVLRAAQQRRGLPDDVEAAVATRIARQRVLRHGGRTAAFLLEESALRNGFGGPQVMTGQLAWLAQITAWPSVSLGIIPAALDRGEARPVEDF